MTLCPFLMRTALKIVNYVLFIFSLIQKKLLIKFFLQISSSAIRTRLVSSDVQEDSDSDDAEALIIEINEEDPRKRFQELDIRSCLQFLLELFEQWLSPFVIPKTPLMLKIEAVRSVRSSFAINPSKFSVMRPYLRASLETTLLEAWFSHVSPLLREHFSILEPCGGVYTFFFYKNQIILAEAQCSYCFAKF